MKFARNLPWLRILFPAAQAGGLQPRDVSDDIQLVCENFHGTENMDRYLFDQQTSAVGVRQINSAQTPLDGSYWYVMACSGLHNDPTSRNPGINLVRAGADVIAIARGSALPTGERFPAPRAFIVPARFNVRFELNTIAAGQTVTLAFLYLNLSVGEAHPSV